MLSPVLCDAHASFPGYPAPDDGLRNLVMGASQTFGPPAGMRLALVFAALLDAVADEVMQCGIETPLDLQRHLESAFTSTRGAGPSVTRREALYNEVYQRVLVRCIRIVCAGLVPDSKSVRGAGRGIWTKTYMILGRLRTSSQAL